MTNTNEQRPRGLRPFYSGAEACAYAERHASGRFSVLIISGHPDTQPMRHPAVIGADFFGSDGSWCFWWV